MSENKGFKKATLVLENSERDIKEVATEIVNELILEFCFDMHRAVKLGYIESYFINEYNKHHQESKSFEGSFLENKLYDQNKQRINKVCQVSSQKETVYTKKINGFEMMDKCGIPFKTDISIKDGRIINSPSVKAKESIKGLEQSERTSENHLKLSFMKSSLSQNINNNDCDLKDLNPIIRISQWKFQEYKIYQVVNGSVFKRNGSVENSDVRKLNDKRFKLSAEGVKPISSLIYHNELTKSFEFQVDDPIEKEWIKESSDCSGCRNSKSFQDWMQFITSTQTEETNSVEGRNTKEILGDKEIQCCVLSEKREQVCTDIFGNSDKSLKKMIYKRTCTCTVCERKVGTVRFAYHLATCMGRGRRRSQRIESSTKRNKR